MTAGEYFGCLVVSLFGLGVLAVVVQAVGAWLLVIPLALLLMLVVGAATGAASGGPGGAQETDTAQVVTETGAGRAKPTPKPSVPVAAPPVARQAPRVAAWPCPVCRREVTRDRDRRGLPVVSQHYTLGRLCTGSGEPVPLRAGAEASSRNEAVPAASSTAVALGGGVSPLAPLGRRPYVRPEKRRAYEEIAALLRAEVQRRVSGPR